MSIQLTTLPNGLRVITDTLPENDSVAVGVWTSVGTRDEVMSENGVAHFLEHMMFKGTPTRTAMNIAEQAEDVGAQMNAYTSREITSYHMHLLKDHVPLAVELIADMFQNALYDEDELAQERKVVLQEIGMTYDTPDDLIYDIYQETAFPGQTVGAPILGPAEIIEKMPRDVLVNFVQKLYTPSRVVISAAGNIQHEEMVKLAEQFFTNLPEDKDHTREEAAYKGGEVRMEKDSEQSHIVLGFEGIPRLDDQYPAAQILSTALGGGMSSRLFQEVREKRGLVYSVYSHQLPMRDSGHFMMYAGTGPDRLAELIPVMCDEVVKVKQDYISLKELDRAKAQVKAALLMGREKMMTRADQQAKHLIFKNEVLNINETIQKLNAVTVEDVKSVAERLFSGAPTLAAIGPLKQLEEFGKIQERLAA